MSRYDEMSQATLDRLKSNDIRWDEYKRVYFTNLHKEFYLKESEVKNEEYLIEFCNLVSYLRSHLEYGVSIEWGDSELNKYVYQLNKEDLKQQFPLTIEALSRFYNDSDIISFYKKTLKAKDPTIIDLIGTTGAGKTTFCQQFVDEEGKEILEKTITPSGNSTIIQTDIVILEETENRLFLKARTKKDIIRDVILLALSIDTSFKFDLNKSINEKSNKAGIKLIDNKDIKFDSEVFKGVYNLFRKDDLIEEFLRISERLQSKHSSEEDIQMLIHGNMENSELADFLDKIVDDELGTDDFYGYRHEMTLDSELILEKTIIPTKTFDKNKDKEESFKDIISYRILFEQAVLVLKCDEKAKKNLPKKFRDGIVFRDSQGHNQSEQVGIATDFEVKNKILLIPAGTGGELVDDKYIDELKNIIISEPEQNVVVITKIDKTSSYEYYEDSYDEFIENLKDQVVTTHNNLIGKLEEPSGQEENEEYLYDRNAIIKKFISSFDNAYLSKIKKSKGKFDHELHQIVCKDKEEQLIEASDIEDISITDTWYDLLKRILERENKVTLNAGKIKLKNINDLDKSKVISDLESQMQAMLNICYKNFKWQNELDKSLKLYSNDFRYIYHEMYTWYNRSILRDISSVGYNISDMASRIVKYINSLVLKSDSKKNAVKHILEVPLVNYLERRYVIGGNLSTEGIANKIITNAISRAALTSYKLFDRNIVDNSSNINIAMITSNKNNYVQPHKSIKAYGVYARGYYTDTAYYLGIYCNLLAKYKDNLETYYLDIFKTAVNLELEKLEESLE